MVDTSKKLPAELCDPLQDKFNGALTDLVTLVSEKFGAALRRR